MFMASLCMSPIHLTFVTTVTTRCRTFLFNPVAPKVVLRFLVLKVSEYTRLCYYRRFVVNDDVARLYKINSKCM